MKIATWNVNSLKVRLPQVLDWLAGAQPDALCLQETKTEDGGFPFAALEAAGYRAIHNGQKTYNGVAILARNELSDVMPVLPDFADPQKRLIAATLGDVRLVCAYMPNGQAVGSDKYEYKLQWLAALARWLKDELQRHPRLALLGDFNIAPDDRDVHDPVAWRGQILCSEPERAAFRALLDLGLVDAFRLFEQPEKSFSWWDYRMMG
ncbi:MAG: exodeoxyribonuclease III, partial [Rhodocyclaceae bacterium]|nr:exodeoxyribonuclease III [Rhodocyclaceae bacterium]